MKKEEKATGKYVHYRDMSFSEVNCPDLIKEAVNILSDKHINVPKTAILNTLRVNLGHVIMSKKVAISQANEKIPPGQFGMILLKSGIGKDYIRKDLKKFVFKKHLDWFKEQADTLHKEMLDLYENQQIEERCRRNKKQQEIEEKLLIEGGKTNDIKSSGINPF